VRSPLNWVGLGDALGESTGPAPLLYAWGLSGCLLVLGGVNALWLWGIRHRTPVQRGLTWGVAGCLTLWPMLWLAAQSAPKRATESHVGPPTSGVLPHPLWRVALVAPHLSADEADGDPLKVERLMAAYRQLNAAEVDVVLMPQSSLNGLSPSEPALRQELLLAVAQQGIALLAGSEQRLPDHHWQRPHQYNAAFLVNPPTARTALAAKPTGHLPSSPPVEAAVQWQAKRRPVLWTEHWPEALRQWPLGGLAQRVAPYVPGEHSEPLLLNTPTGRTGQLGVMLCYDAYAPDLATELTAKGSQVLVVLSSDESFAGSALSRQGLRMAWSRAGTGAYDAQGRRLPSQALAQPVPGVTLWQVPLAVARAL
jgi:apolipoprotein N-acyltransferase